MAKKNYKKEQGEDVNYWRSLADVLLGLLLVIILVLLLWTIGFYREEEEQKPVESGETTVQESIEETKDDWDVVIIDHDNDGGDNGGGNDIVEPIETVEDPTEGFGGDDYTGKSAVEVVVIDSETDEPIKSANIVFELYNYKNVRQILNTYYPKKITYEKFVTTEQGNFYLPEKIVPSKYYFKNLTVPYGYEMAEDAYFEFDRGYDWSEPLVVYIEMKPCKNNIRLQVNDKTSGAPVVDGTYPIVAMEDIITEDGTIRFRRGDVVDTIHLNETGYGESKELYLGNYQVVQEDITFGYAAMKDELFVKVDKRLNDSEEKKHFYEIKAEKTEILVDICDETNPSNKLADLQFEIVGKDGVPYDLFTDKNGQIRLTDLYKDTTYRIRQKTAPEHYRLADTTYSLYVDKKGYIDQQILGEVHIEGRIIRTRYDITEHILRRSLTGYTMVLFDTDGNALQAWESNASNYAIDGLEPGTYYLSGQGKDGRRICIEIKDTKDIQFFSYKVWSVADIVILTIVVLILLLILAWILFGWWKNRKKRKEIEEKLKREQEQLEESKQKEASKGESPSEE